MNTTRLTGALLVLACALEVTPARAGAPYGRYQVTTETVYDNKTRLTWQRVQAPPFSSGTPSYTETEGLAYCATLSLGSFASGWRLPTKKELETLVDPTVAITSTQLAIDQTAFPTAVGSAYLTSTPYALTELVDGGNSEFWVVYFSDGDSQGTSTNDGFVYNVRCVH